MYTNEKTSVSASYRSRGETVRSGRGITYLAAGLDQVFIIVYQSFLGRCACCINTKPPPETSLFWINNIHLDEIRSAGHPPPDEDAMEEGGKD